MMFLTVLLVLAPSAAPDIAGTWLLDSGRSRVVNEVGWPGLIGAGAPERIHITQAANGTVVIESEINESHSRIYKPGGKTSTPVAQTSTITMSSKWEGTTLASEGSLIPPSGAPVEVKEAITLSDDGLTLTVQISTVNTSASTLVYTRTESVEPCEKWPTLQGSGKVALYFHSQYVATALPSASTSYS
jgi:hypothetical protein